MVGCTFSVKWQEKPFAEGHEGELRIAAEAWHGCYTRTLKHRLSNIAEDPSEAGGTC